MTRAEETGVFQWKTSLAGEETTTLSVLLSGTGGGGELIRWDGVVLPAGAKARFDPRGGGVALEVDGDCDGIFEAVVAGTGEVVAEYQLKATDNVAYVNEHIIKYPDVEVIVTDEVAARMDGVQASGNLNTDLSETVDSDIDALAGNTIDDRVLESGGLAATIATGQELVEMLQGKREFPEAVTNVAKKTSTAGAATAIAAYLFS